MAGFGGIAQALTQAVAAKQAAYPAPGHNNTPVGQGRAVQPPPGWSQGQKTGWKGGTQHPGFGGRFSVDTANVTHGPFTTLAAANAVNARLSNNRVFAAKPGKAPETLYAPPGNRSVARFPSGKPVPRVPY